MLKTVTPTIRKRRFDEEDMKEVAELITLTLTDFEKNADEVRARVKALCEKHPLYE